MFALEKDANVEAFLNEFHRSRVSWENAKTNILKHLAKADIVPMYIKHFDNKTLVKILGFVLSLPKNQRDKIIFVLD